jgi:D-serine dehydratase
MKLTNPWFEAEFYGKAHGVAFTRQGPSIEGAQGLFLWCPCGYGRPDGAAHGLIVPFANPRNAPQLPPVHGPQARDGSQRPRWTMTGTGLDDLTLTPSVDVGEPSCWHGYIAAGEVR